MAPTCSKYDSSIWPSWLSGKNLRAKSSLEVELSKTWPNHCPNMALAWSYKLDTQENVLDQFTSVSKVWFNSIEREQKYFEFKLYVYKHTYKKNRKTNRPGPRGDPTRGWSPKKQALKANTALNSNNLKVWGWALNSVRAISTSHCWNL